MSASAPAGRASRKTGAELAACTSATIRGLGASEVISQPAPTSCIQEPMFDATDAIHNMRNTRLERGAQGETGLGRAAVTVRLRQALFSACFQVRSGMQVCRRYTARSTSAAWI